jgi:hypothetical protein
VKRAAQSRGRARTPRRWAGPCDQRTAHDFGDEIARNLYELFVHRADVRSLAHQNSFAVPGTQGRERCADLCRE